MAKGTTRIQGKNTVTAAAATSAAPTPRRSFASVGWSTRCPPRAAETVVPTRMAALGGHRVLQPTEARSEEHTSELQSSYDLVCRLLLEKKNYIMSMKSSIA